jgi:hypothetical protein
MAMDMARNTDVKIPSEILEVIAQKNEEIKEEQERVERERREEAARWLDMGHKRLLQDYSAALALAPAWIRPFSVTLRNWDEEELRKLGQCIARNWGHSETDVMWFEIPGLATVQFGGEKRGWRTEQAYQSHEWGKPPAMRFEDYWRQDLPSTLVIAEKAARELMALQQEFEERQEERQALNELSSEVEAGVAQRQEERQAAEKSEEMALFDTIKNDEVALLLLRTLVAVHQERSTLTRQIEEATETTWSVEERLTQRAAELRRQADDAERRADDERRRASDLEDDLAKEKKLRR